MCARSKGTGNQKYNRYQTDYIKSVADVETVAECLGLETQKRGSNISILCPCHNDTHYGSCYLTKDGFQCYACGAHGDMFELVQRVRNVSFREACDYVCSLYGKASDFQDAAEIHHKRILDKESLQLIGVYNEPIYLDIAVVPFDYEADGLKRTQRLKWVPYRIESEPVGIFDPPLFNNEQDGYYVLQEMVCKNPLQQLLDEDEPAYNDLICRKAIEASDRYQSMIEMAQNPAKFYEDGNINAFMVAYYCSQIAEIAGMGAWKNELERRIRKCDDIRIEFSQGDKGEKPQNNKTRKRTSVFGKIKKSGISL